MFITICGIDGSGKTTLGRRLALELEQGASLSQQPPRVVFTKLIDKDSEFVRYYKMLVDVDPLFDGTSQNYVFAFERMRTANEVLRRLLATHDVVIIDRYVYCDFAYSRARGRDSSMYYTVLKHVPVPDVGFVIDVPVEIALDRIAARQVPAWIFQENRELLARARETYLQVAREFGLEVIDGAAPVERSIQTIFERLRACDIKPYRDSASAKV